MDPLARLSAELQAHEFSSDSEGNHAKKILGILDNALLHHEGQLRDRIPPLDLVIYTLKTILYLPSPQFLSELLHLVSIVEYYRTEVTQKASKALVFNTYYKENPDQPYQLLDEKTEEYYTHLTNTQDSLRKIFMEIVVECCVKDLKRLWIANSNTDFWVRWNEYFSIFTKAEGTKLSHSFHHDLSSEEISGLYEASCVMAGFMESTMCWAGNEGGRGQSIQATFDTSAFRDRFAQPELSERITNLVDYYISYVNEAVGMSE
ncbi:hypothetical protein M413DRAFT_441878 [Hebeloma cylindrosporum]|uniref:Uncharacterized protein n=1 Tax=Hebeloma cylindrosporum TaxID=76867 RepID=A0A0C2YW47_HEBCY|nr:hypothetical protein M413DRAFT_441878 [Hebeloma cylindrosporum h7]